jgi:Protein of unknown function (DUF1579)
MTRSTTAAPPKPSPTAEHKRLTIFLGTWNLQGRQHATRVGPAVEITGTERFEWLAGGFFLVHHFDARVGDAPAACIEVTGYDASTGTYPIHTYYNNGQSAEWEPIERDGTTWILTGEWPMQGETVQVRCTIEFADEGNSRTARWESSSDGTRWETFWDVKATRA